MNFGRKRILVDCEGAFRRDGTRVCVCVCVCVWCVWCVCVSVCGVCGVLCVSVCVCGVCVHFNPCALKDLKLF